jgi:hypothetical protein
MISKALQLFPEQIKTGLIVLMHMDLINNQTSQQTACLLDSFQL